MSIPRLINFDKYLDKRGFFADIIAVNEDPTKNISTMENVVFVMKNGVIYKK